MDCLACLQEAISARRPVAMVTVVSAPGRGELVGCHLVAAVDQVLAVDFADPALEPALSAIAAEAIAAGAARSVKVSGVRVYVEAYLPLPALVVVGAGHVAQPIAQIGHMLGFEVTVIDDRAQYANRSRFPTANQIIADGFVPVLRSLNLGPRHHVVLVTRGHRHDLDCLREVIQLPLAYIGMIGSRTRVDIVFRLLQEEEGIDRSHFAKVYAPIGLDIGAQSPEEIAVAVAAELVKIRHRGTGESLSRLGRALVHGR